MKNRDMLHRIITCDLGGGGEGRAGKKGVCAPTCTCRCLCVCLHVCVCRGGESTYVVGSDGGGGGGGRGS